MAKINVLGILVIFLVILANLYDVKKPDLITPSKVPIPTKTLTPIPTTKVLQNGGYHIYQTFNNCGPAALSMALSYYGISESQQKLGLELRPYQIKSGINDDKSVTLSEIAEKSRDYGFIPYLRPNGNEEIIKNFIAIDIPVITRTWTYPNEDIGHYRVVKGYDKSKGVLIQDDSLQGKNLEYTYKSFDELWEKFNYEYLVLVPTEKVELAELIIGEDVDEKLSWKKAADIAINKLQDDPFDIYARFNLSIALYHSGRLDESITEFEKVESKLPFRTLWYQIEPIMAYYEAKRFEKVFMITDKILNGGNKAYSELYTLRGNIFRDLGEISKSEIEFQQAEKYRRPVF